MPTEYEDMVTAMKALTQGEEPDTVTLPVAENDWNTRPDTGSRRRPTKEVCTCSAGRRTEPGGSR